MHLIHTYDIIDCKVLKYTTKHSFSSSRCIEPFKSDAAERWGGGNTKCMYRTKLSCFMKFIFQLKRDIDSNKIFVRNFYSTVNVNVN